METITVDELKEKVLSSEPVKIIDVRTDEETAMGIIPGAETIPMNDIPDNVNHFNSDETYYIICKVGVVVHKLYIILNNRVSMPLTLKAAWMLGETKALKIIVFK